MSAKVLEKEVLVQRDHVWSFDNSQDPSAISSIYYALVVPNIIRETLKDFSEEQEVEFWDLTFLLAHEAAQKTQSPIFVGMNDGVYAGQTVPHAHSHIAAMRDDYWNFAEDFGCASGHGTSKQLSFQEQFNALREDGRGAEPAAKATLLYNLNDPSASTQFTERLREIRRNLLEQNDRYDFRIYGQSPIRATALGAVFTVEACDETCPQFSVGTSIRVLHRLMKPEELYALPHSTSRFSHFEPLPPKT